MAKRRRRGRDICGILLLDKPAGVTSNGALQMAKKMFAAAKAGHTGSLDPLATGLLPICFGEATKFSQYLLNADKTYEVEARLGERTETGDADGEVIETRPVDVTGQQVADTLESFIGEIQQIPSMYSAIKHNGEPLYKLARQGIEVERKPRTVTIYQLDSVALDGDTLSFRVKCSKGTYVRSLVEDTGEKLGCGAHVTALRRVETGPWSAAQMTTLEKLGNDKADGGFEAVDAQLLPLSSSVDDWPRAELGDNAAYYLMQGQPVMADVRPSSGHVSLYRSSDDTFLGVGEVQDDGMVAPRRLIAH